MMTKWEFRKLVRIHRKRLGYCCPLGVVAKGCGVAFDKSDEFWANPTPGLASKCLGLCSAFAQGIVWGWDHQYITTTSKEIRSGYQYARRLRKIYYRKNFQSCETPTEFL